MLAAHMAAHMRLLMLFPLIPARIPRPRAKSVAALGVFRAKACVRAARGARVHAHAQVPRMRRLLSPCPPAQRRIAGVLSLCRRGSRGGSQPGGAGEVMI
eukprot:3444081-Alexandrium_andersonii.AAC.1